MIDGLFITFESNTIKLSVNETKWTGLSDVKFWLRARKVTGTFETRPPGHTVHYSLRDLSWSNGKHYYHEE